MVLVRFGKEHAEFITHDGDAVRFSGRLHLFAHGPVQRIDSVNPACFKRPHPKRLAIEGKALRARRRRGHAADFHDRLRGLHTCRFGANGQGSRRTGQAAEASA